MLGPPLDAEFQSEVQASSPLEADSLMSRFPFLGPLQSMRLHRLIGTTQFCPVWGEQQGCAVFRPWAGQTPGHIPVTRGHQGGNVGVSCRNTESKASGRELCPCHGPRFRLGLCSDHVTVCLGHAFGEGGEYGGAFFPLSSLITLLSAHLSPLEKDLP